MLSALPGKNCALFFHGPFTTRIMHHSIERKLRKYLGKLKVSVSCQVIQKYSHESISKWRHSKGTIQTQIYTSRIPNVFRSHHTTYKFSPCKSFKKDNVNYAPLSLFILFWQRHKHLMGEYTQAASLRIFPILIGFFGRFLRFS